MIKCEQIPRKYSLTESIAAVDLNQIRYVPIPSRPTHRRKQVLIQCLACKEERWSNLHDVQRKIRDKTLSGMCQKCFGEYILPFARCSVEAGRLHGQWKGGKVITATGYVDLHYLLIPEEDRWLVTPGRNKARSKRNRDYVAEHRYVMAKHIGRPLTSEETVHHKNGDRADNRIENLELWASSHNAGQRIEDQVKWAVEILSKYGELFPNLTQNLPVAE